MASIIQEYRAGASRCEKQAKNEKDSNEREWQMCLARAYRMLAKIETERRKVAMLADVGSERVADYMSAALEPGYQKIGK
jgi:hypothetical protein